MNTRNFIIKNFLAFVSAACIAIYAADGSTLTLGAGIWDGYLALFIALAERD